MNWNNIAMIYIYVHQNNNAAGGLARGKQHFNRTLLHYTLLYLTQPYAWLPSGGWKSQWAWYSTPQLYCCCIVPLSSGQYVACIPYRRWTSSSLVVLCRSGKGRDQPSWCTLGCRHCRTNGHSLRSPVHCNLPGRLDIRSPKIVHTAEDLCFAGCTCAGTKVSPKKNPWKQSNRSICFYWVACWASSRLSEHVNCCC